MLFVNRRRVHVVSMLRRADLDAIKWRIFFPIRETHNTNFIARVKLDSVDRLVAHELHRFGFNAVRVVSHAAFRIWYPRLTGEPIADGMAPQT